MFNRYESSHRWIENSSVIAGEFQKLHFNWILWQGNWVRFKSVIAGDFKSEFQEWYWNWIKWNVNWEFISDSRWISRVELKLNQVTGEGSSSCVHFQPRRSSLPIWILNIGLETFFGEISITETFCTFPSPLGQNFVYTTFQLPLVAGQTNERQLTSHQFIDWGNKTKPLTKSIIQILSALLALVSCRKKYNMSHFGQNHSLSR